MNVESIQGRHFSFFQGGGTILTDFLRGGAKYEETKLLCAKTQKNHYFSKSGAANAPLPPQNDVPESIADCYRSFTTLSYFPTCIDDPFTYS